MFCKSTDLENYHSGNSMEVNIGSLLHFNYKAISFIICLQKSCFETPDIP